MSSLSTILTMRAQITNRSTKSACCPWSQRHSRAPKLLASLTDKQEVEKLLQ